MCRFYFGIVTPSMRLDERLTDPNNWNPALQKIVTLSIAYDGASPRQILESRATIGSFAGGSMLGELLERVPDPRRPSGDQRLGRWGGNVEVYALESGDRKIVITNGFSRRRKDKFRLEKVIHLRKIEGVWTEWKENISR